MSYKKFTITEDHLKLLQRFYVKWYDAETVAPAINPKRPYGNSYVERDIAKILGWQLNNDGELTNDQQERAMTLHKETEIALQICLYNQSFETGEYYQKEQYNTRIWLRVK